MCDIRKLMRADIQLFCKNLPVTYCLVQHIDEIRILKDIFDFLGSKQILNVLGDACRKIMDLSR